MNPQSSDDKFIDIDDVIRKKNPKLLKAIPSFLIRYLKNIIHQDDLNDILKNNKNNYGLAFVAGALVQLETKYSIINIENIPTSGRYIFASNHPLGGLDGLIMLDVVGKNFPDCKFVVNDLLMNIKNLESILLPVNKHGRQSNEYFKLIDDAYKSNTQILYFPAGLCSRKINGIITDTIWHKSFITNAVKYERDIIPVYFEARNSNFFYNLARIRKFLGIKINFEMLYLPDEMYKQKKRKISISFGKPISYKIFDKNKTPSEWALYIREIVYSLKNNKTETQNI